METPLLERFGRRLRVGMVGGGIGSFIGETHRIALRADGLWDLVGGIFSRDLEKSRQMGRRLLLHPDRVYADHRELIDGEHNREDPMDAVIVATLPDTHREIAAALLDAGFHVVCEKPMTATLDEAQELAEVVRSSGRRLMLTHCYTGYPMVRMAREMVAHGELGRITLVDVEFASGAFADLTADDAVPWRLSATATGGGGMLGDVGTHAFQLAEFVSGDQVAEVSARLDEVGSVAGDVPDNAFVDLRFSSGARGRLWSTFQATGAVHGLRIAIYGDKASLHWDHETAEVMWLRPTGAPAQQLTKGAAPASADVLDACRFPTGHPDGYGLAFANLYRDFALLLIGDQLGDDTEYQRTVLPNGDDGVRTLGFVDATTRSDAHDAAWTPVEAS